MTSTFTPNKGVEKPGSGDYVDQWATPVNADWDVIDTSFGGITNLSATGQSGIVALTVDQYRPPNVNITGVLTANVSYRLPSGVGGQWSVANNTSGAFTITFSSGGGGTVVPVLQGYRTLVICDGTNVVYSQTAPINAAGSDTQVQYNSLGLFAGSANLTFDGSNLALKSNLILRGSTSGAISFSPPAVAGATSYTLPGADGSNGQVLTTNGTGTLAWTSSTGSLSSFSAGSTGLTPSIPTTGAIVLGGVLNVTNGGTGLSLFTSGGALFASGPTTLSTGTLPISSGGTGGITAFGALNNLLPSQTGLNNFVLTTNGSGVFWSAGAGVSSFSGGSTGLTPSFSSTGPVTLAGTLNISNGGTGATNASQALTNLGLGTAALQAIGTSGANVPLLSNPNNWGANQSIRPTPTTGFLFFGTGGAAIGYDGSKYVSGLTGAAANWAFPNECFAVSFNNTSDYRLKSDIRPLTWVGDALERISLLKPCIFKMEGVDGDVEGFIAHEVQAVIASAAKGEKDAENEDGTPDYQAIDSARIVPLLVAAIQQLTDKVASLEAQVQAT